MNKNLKIVIIVLLSAVLALIIFYPKLKPVFANMGNKNEGPVPGMRQGRQVLNVSGFLVVPTAMSDLYNSVGSLRPDEEVDLSFETSGKIVGINFTEGTRVKKGDLLAKINDKPLQAQLQKLEAQKELVEGKEDRKSVV